MAQQVQDVQMFPCHVWFYSPVGFYVLKLAPSISFGRR